MFYIGADYYPEHWPPERWSSDAKMMADAGINVVRLAEFSWSRLEPRRGRYDFRWLDRAIDTLWAEGIHIILGTPTAAPPPWLIDRHPSILPVTPQRRRVSYGARRQYCPTHAVYRRYSRWIVTEMARHYSKHPAVIGWQIDNEFGCHNTARCYCDGCALAFREWLKRRYGSIKRLNECWGTVFWSQEYTDWLQVPLPWDTGIPMNARVPAHNPSLVIDFYRFASEANVRFQKEQVNVIRSHCPGHFVTHNLMGLFDQIDYFDLAEDLDFVAWDNYPGDGSDPHRVGLAHDVMRGLKRRNFWVMEQQSGPTGWSVNSPAPRPGQIRLWAMQAIGHGAEAIVFFRWRTCRYGVEQFWHGILDHDGSENRRYKEITALSKELERVAPSWFGASCKSSVAIVLSYESAWALEIHQHNTGLNYWTEIRKYYEGARRLGLGVDIVKPEQILSDYSIVIAPMLYLVRERVAQNFENYVRGGGTLVLTFRSGIKDMYNIVYAKAPPGPLQTVVGTLVEEYDSLSARDHNSVLFSPTGRSYQCRAWCDVLSPDSVETLGTFEHDFYAGKPAIVRHRLGRGQAIYVGTTFDPSFYPDFLSFLAADAGISTWNGLPAGVELSIRTKGESSFVFLMNHAGQPVTVPFPKGGHSLLTGDKTDGEVALGPYGVDVIKMVNG